LRVKTLVNQLVCRDVCDDFHLNRTLKEGGWVIGVSGIKRRDSRKNVNGAALPRFADGQHV
jgi:hypothetical protein